MFRQGEQARWSETAQSLSLNHWRASLEAGMNIESMPKVSLNWRWTSGRTCVKISTYFSALFRSLSFLKVKELFLAARYLRRRGIIWGGI